MAECKHEISFDVTKGEFCPYCGNPLLRHHTLKEVASRLAISEKTARRWFKAEPGILPVDGEGERVHIRVPEFVVERVRRRRSIGGV